MPWTIALIFLARSVRVALPNRVWSGDITHVSTTDGWLYLAVVLDLYSRTVIGWAMDHRMTVDLAECPHHGVDASETHGGVL